MRLAGRILAGTAITVSVVAAVVGLHSEPPLPVPVDHSPTGEPTDPSPLGKALRVVAAAELPPPMPLANPLAAPDVAVQPPPPPSPQVPIAYLNRSVVVYDYEVTRKGVSGLQVVRLWVTSDDGRTWGLAAAVKPGEPLRASLGKDGRYGARLGLVSGAGLSTPEPKAGDTPELTVVVDTLPPVVQVTAGRAGGAASGLVIDAAVWDENLDTGAAQVQWRDADDPKPEWHDIRPGSSPGEGRNLDVTGPLSTPDNLKGRRVSCWRWKWAWEPTNPVPAKVLVRVVVTDRAGNVAECVTPQPVATDTVRPQGRLTGVRLDGPGAPPEKAPVVAPPPRTK
jgi:hypothetical protein